MSGPPMVSGTAAKMGPQSSGVLRPRQRRVGRNRRRAKLNSPLLPGDWRVNVDFSGLTDGGGGGTTYRLQAGAFTDTHANRRGIMGARAPTGVQGHMSTGSSFFPSQDWFIASDYPDMTPDGPLLIDEFWYAGGAMGFVNDLGYWAGPVQHRGGTYGYFYEMFGGPPGGGNNPSYMWAAAYNTAGTALGNLNPGPLNFTLDPVADFNHPLIGVWFESTSSIYVDGQYPPPLQYTDPPFMGGPPVITLYNGVHTLSWALDNTTPFSHIDSSSQYGAAWTDSALGLSDFVTLHDINPPHGDFVDWGAYSMTTSAFAGFANITLPPEKYSTQLADQQVGHLLR